MAKTARTIFLTGGGGYVGAALVPKLLARGHRVKVLDLLLFGRDVLPEHPGLAVLRGDIRDQPLLARELAGCDTVIHLACISNDPSFDLDPDLGMDINHRAFTGLLSASKAAGVRHFVFASSSSIYGVRSEPEVTEDLAPEPLTGYSRCKVLCEDELRAGAGEAMAWTILRPATLSGYSPRLRLDLTVNILASHALHRGRIRVFGGEQYRPNLHIDDMTDLYCRILDEPLPRVAGRTWNAVAGNHTVLEIAHAVRDTLGGGVAIDVEPTEDRRSYRVTGTKLQRDLGVVPERGIADAVRDLKSAFASGLVPDPEDPRYHNVRLMRSAGLK